MERAGGVGCADVQPQAARAASVSGGAARGLEHLARDLIDRRVPVAAKRRVVQAVARGILVRRGVAIAQAVRALVPLLAAVRARSDQVVPGEIDQRRLPAGRPIGGLAGRCGWRIVDREPLPIRARAAAIAAEEVLLV